MSYYPDARPDGSRELRDAIMKFIDQYDGTIIGYEVKNMLENGTDVLTICDYAGIPYDPSDG